MCSLSDWEISACNHFHHVAEMFNMDIIKAYLNECTISFGEEKHLSI